MVSVKNAKKDMHIGEVNVELRIVLLTRPLPPVINVDQIIKEYLVFVGDQG